MLKKIFIVLAVLSALSPQAFSQQEPAKVLILVHAGADDIFGFAAAVSRALELKKDGVNVRVVFEGGSVIYFLGEEFINADTAPGLPPGPLLPRSDFMPGASTSTVTSTTPPMVLSSTAIASTDKPPRGFKAEPSDNSRTLLNLLAEFNAAKIPYTLCSFSATFLGKYDKLKKLGMPLSKDPAKLIGIAAFVKDGYQVIGY